MLDAKIFEGVSGAVLPVSNFFEVGFLKSVITEKSKRSLASEIISVVGYLLIKLGAVI